MFGDTINDTATGCYGSNLNHVTRFLFCVAVLCACSCNIPADRLLQQSESLIRHSPDSAIRMLQKIRHPEDLAARRRMIYYRMLSELSYRKGSYRKADSLIHISLSITANDSVERYKCLFLAGMIHYRKGEPGKALDCFTGAGFFLTDKDNAYRHRLYGWTGHCLHMEGEYGKAVAAHQTAAAYALQTDSASVCYNYWDIALVYRSAGKLDSALYYYRKALLAMRSGHRESLSKLYNEMSEMFMERDNFHHALLYADSSLTHKRSRNETALYHLTKARIFMALNMSDSVAHYIKIAAQNPDQYVATAAYAYLMQYEKETGRYENAYWALQNTELHTERIQSRIQSDILVQKFEEERLKNENNLLKLAKREREIYLLVMGIISLCIFVLWFILYALNRKKRLIVQHRQEEQKLADQTMLMEQKNMLLKKEHELSLLREKAASLRETIFKKMSVSQKIPSLDNSISTSNGINKRITLSEKDWDELIQTVEEAYGGFVVRLLQQAPLLTKNDIGFCCLVKIKVNMKDLSDIYCISKAGITKRKIRMKKEKFKIAADNVTLDDFLQTL
ncbi:MAG: hypothetical protein LBR08_06320 [Bacteroidales bacterium]|jgi:tetratricopeptide (TPR) repeat protein|nr:hypothetical protein [Bacteroidales bacterium]